MLQNHLSQDEDTVNTWPPGPSFPRGAGAQRHPLLQEKAPDDERPARKHPSEAPFAWD